jgi:hypothetical protein
MGNDIMNGNCVWNVGSATRIQKPPVVMHLFMHYVRTKGTHGRGQTPCLSKARAQFRLAATGDEELDTRIKKFALSFACRRVDAELQAVISREEEDICLLN